MSDAAVIAVIRAQEEATSQGNARAIVDALSADVVVFDLPPPLAYRGDRARDVNAVEDWFATWRDGVTVHLADPQITISSDLAVAFGLSRMVGIKTDGTKVDSWSRRTIVCSVAAGLGRSFTSMPVFPWQWTEVDGR